MLPVEHAARWITGSRDQVPHVLTGNISAAMLVLALVVIGKRRRYNQTRRKTY
jgi:hypothetical protein